MRGRIAEVPEHGRGDRRPDVGRLGVGRVLTLDCDWHCDVRFMFGIPSSVLLLLFGDRVQLWVEVLVLTKEVSGFSLIHTEIKKISL